MRITDDAIRESSGERMISFPDDNQFLSMAITSSMGTDFDVISTPTPPANTTMLNCGYNCSRYIYNQPVTRHSYDMLTDEERSIIKDEYYRNYDLMTGLRTAASLGGTIVLFSLFILYKMKCRRHNHRRKSLAPSSVITLDNDHRPELHDNFEKELACPLNGNGAMNSNVISGSTGSPPALIDDCTGKGCCGSTDLPSVHGIVVPRFRINSEPEGRRLPTAPSGSFLVEPNIDIHIIQPTPNISPSGSIRRLSEDVATAISSYSDADVRTSQVPTIIPLLSIPKIRTKGMKSGSRITRSSRDRVRERSDGCSSSSLLPFDDVVTSRAGGVDRCRRRLSSAEMKYIDCSDSDACSSDSVRVFVAGNSVPTIAVPTSPPVCFNLGDSPLTTVAPVGVHRTKRTVPKLDPVDANVEVVSETRC